MLSEAEMLGCKSIDFSMDVNTKLLLYQGELLAYVEWYRLVGKLNYLPAVSIVSQSLRTTNLKTIMRILRYLQKASGRGLLYLDHEHTRVADISDANWAGCLFDRRSITRYCVFLGENLV